MARSSWCCLVFALAVATSAVPCASQMPSYPPPRGVPPTPLGLSEGNIITSTDGELVTLKAAVWGGQNSQPFSSFVHIEKPESVGSSTLSQGIVTAAYQLRKDGFNTVILPFSFMDFTAGHSTPHAHSCQQIPAPGTITDTAAIRQADAAISTAQLQPGVLDTIRQHASNTGGNSTQPPCLSLLPNTTTQERFLWAMQWFVANGLYVVLSSADGNTGHVCRTAASRTRGSSGPHACKEGASAAVASWVQLWQSVVELPSFGSSIQGRVMLQLLQVSAGTQEQRWEAFNTSSGQRQPGLQALYLDMMDAIDNIQPGAALFILQGPQQEVPEASGFEQWGNGFTTDPVLISQGLSDPTPLFKALKHKPYSNQVILAPRTSRLAASNSTGSAAPGASRGHAVAAMAVMDEDHPEGPKPKKMLDNSFHRLSQRGFCVAEGECVRFPVIVAQQPPDASGQGHVGNTGNEDFDTFADYILMHQATGKGADKNVAATGSWYQWDVMDDDASP